MSRLNQLNTGLAFPLLRWGIPQIVSGLCVVHDVHTRVTAALGYRVPSSPMPWPALEQPHRGQPATPDQPVLAQRIDRVLTASRAEPTGWQPHRRDGAAVELDQEDQAARGRGSYRRHQRCPPIRGRVRRSAVRSSCSSRAEIACLLLGSARMTTRSAWSSSSITVRATWRSRRATRCRCTALPTDFETTSPIRGPSCAVPSDTRNACTTRSGCTARTP
jgi:hypothetical protein